MPLTSYATDENGVALLRLEREQARNAINTEMLDELLEHLDRARRDPETRVLVISSNDHLALSAGADVREVLRDEHDRHVGREERRIGRPFLHVHANGAVFGAGIARRLGHERLGIRQQDRDADRRLAAEDLLQK